MKPSVVDIPRSFLVFEGGALIRAQWVSWSQGRLQKKEKEQHLRPGLECGPGDFNLEISRRSPQLRRRITRPARRLDSRDKDCCSDRRDRYQTSNSHSELKGELSLQRTRLSWVASRCSENPKATYSTCTTPSVPALWSWLAFSQWFCPPYLALYLHHLRSSFFLLYCSLFWLSAIYYSTSTLGGSWTAAEQHHTTHFTRPPPLSPFQHQLHGKQFSLVLNGRKTHPKHYPLYIPNLMRYLMP